MSFVPQDPIGANKVSTVPAPTGGLNARDSLANMDPTDAILLNNWWPEPYGCRVRQGSRAWAIGIPGEGGLAVWHGTDGTEKLFTFGWVPAGDTVTGGIFDISERMLPDTPPPTAVYEGITSITPLSLQMVNDGGAHLFIISGNGPVVLYNTTGFTPILFSPDAPPEPPVDNTWYGGPGEKTRQMTSHQGRLWSTDCESSVGYYLPVDAIWGKWERFDFGPQMTLGGAIHSLTTWTIDDGNGAEDHLVALTTGGQAIVYGGTSPNSVETWSLVGVYNIGEPVGLPGRCFTKVGGDLVILTQRGLVSMAALLVSTKVNAGVNPVNSAKIQLLLATAASLYPQRREWQVIYHAPNNMFLINLPAARGQVESGQRQLVSNLVTEACPWAAFSDIDAASWISYQHMPYFGTIDGRIYRAMDGWVDEADLNDANGYDVRTQVQQAYSYLGAPAIQKQVGMYRPGFLVSEEIVFGAAIEYDFLVRRVRVPSDNAAAEGASVWADKDAPNPIDGIWDQSIWAGGIFPYRRWIQAEGIGTAASLRMAMSSHNDILWVATDYSYRTGGVL